MGYYNVTRKKGARVNIWCKDKDMKQKFNYPGWNLKLFLDFVIRFCLEIFLSNKGRKDPWNGHQIMLILLEELYNVMI